MTDDNMASRIPLYRSLAPQLGSALKSFQSSGSKFRVLKTVHPSRLQPENPQPPPPDESPKTLFILDSSFNPPSIAHQTLAQSALRRSASNAYRKPHRLLLLFATMNADKAPSAASFDQRLTLMTIWAADILRSIRDQPHEYSVVPIDIGVTTVPYYTEKAKAIEAEGQIWYPDAPHHIQLIGFDTLTRFFAAKYYPQFTPPLSALHPYFDPGHCLRVTLRPDDEYGTIDEQTAFLTRLENGEMEREGGRREWATQVELVPPHPRVGVSSTKIRRAAKAGDWETLAQLCTPGVAEYVKSERLYNDDDSGGKTT